MRRPREQSRSVQPSWRSAASRVASVQAPRACARAGAPARDAEPCERDRRRGDQQRGNQFGEEISRTSRLRLFSVSPTWTTSHWPHTARRRESGAPIAAVEKQMLSRRDRRWRGQFRDAVDDFAAFRADLKDHRVELVVHERLEGLPRQVDALPSRRCGCCRRYRAPDQAASDRTHRSRRRAPPNT